MIVSRIHTFVRLAVPLAILAGVHLTSASARADFTFSAQTLNNNADPTFNQLLGINNAGTIAGYFGSGTPPTTHPNQGYTLDPPYQQANYTNENFPGSSQTQVTGINNSGVTVGFYADPKGDNFGFVKSGFTYTAVIDPLTPTTPTVATTQNQLLGVNDNKQAAGFYTDANGNAHGYVYNIASPGFTPINVAGATSVTATGINNAGMVSGFFTNASGNMLGFVENANGTGLQTFSAPNSTSTMLLGLNNNGWVVGTYVDAQGAMHGLEWNSVTHSFQSIDAPNGIGTTTINGLNDNNQLVGFYVDGQGNTNGLLLTPTAVPEPGSLTLMGLGLLGVLLASRRKKLSSI